MIRAVFCSATRCRSRCSGRVNVSPSSWHTAMGSLRDSASWVACLVACCSCFHMCGWWRFTCPPSVGARAYRSRWRALDSWRALRPRTRVGRNRGISKCPISVPKSSERHTLYRFESSRFPLLTLQRMPKPFPALLATIGVFKM